MRVNIVKNLSAVGTGHCRMMVVVTASFVSPGRLEQGAEKKKGRYRHRNTKSTGLLHAFAVSLL